MSMSGGEGGGGEVADLPLFGLQEQAGAGDSDAILFLDVDSHVRTVSTAHIELSKM